MLISDLCSELCSSDLAGRLLRPYLFHDQPQPLGAGQRAEALAAGAAPEAAAGLTAWPEPLCPAKVGTQTRGPSPSSTSARTPSALSFMRDRAARDRKSVGSGKIVAVRVRLGGCRII